MEGREYDKAVDDGLNKAVGYVFGSITEIHVIVDYVLLFTDHCQMQYCLIVDQDFAEIVEEKIATNPSDLEEAWENNVEDFDGSSSDSVVIVINSPFVDNPTPVDTFFGNYSLLAAITFGVGALCCSFICMCLRMKRSEIRLLSQQERLDGVRPHPSVEMLGVQHDDHEEPERSSSQPRMYKSPEIAQPGSIQHIKAKVISGSEDRRAMEMPLPPIDSETSDSERKIRERQHSRYEGQTEIPAEGSVHVINSPNYSAAKIARPAKYEYEEIALPAKQETTRGRGS